MPTTQLLPVNSLAIDLENFRTVKQTDEYSAALAMIAVSPDYFWGLLDSLLNDGYLPTENIIVLRMDSGVNLVKEGNRRIAAMKMIHGILSVSSHDLPTTIATRIAALPAQWRADNLKVPCAVYMQTDAGLVDRIVTLTHGKGEKAGRDQWNAVARARHNRDGNGASEPALDLLEKYFSFATNHTPQQVERWSGNYNLTVLDEAIKRAAGKFGAASSPDLAKKYPSTVLHKAVLDDIILAIGLGTLGFKAIRGPDDFTLSYGMPSPTATAPNTPPSPDSTRLPGGVTAAAGGEGVAGNGNGVGQGSGRANGASQEGAESPQPSGTNTTPPTDTTNSPGSTALSTGSGKVAATPINDEKSVRRALRGLKPLGQNRSKVVTLKNEALKLKLAENPIAFCFLLRSMFEISGKSYCDDHASAGGPSAKKDGKEKSLFVLLKDITSHLTQNSSDQAMTKKLHGTLTQLAKADGILSVTSMNQLVHNPSFIITSSDICSLFSNVFPLLEEMNK